MTCKDDKTYPYPPTNVFGNDSILTIYTGCGYKGITADDFLVAAELGLLGGLVDFEDGTILKVVDGNFVDSGLRYDSELEALVYDGKIIADELEVSTDTISISQRLDIEAFGNSVEFKDTFNNDRRLPIYTKVNEQGSLGNFFAQVGAEQPIIIQDQFDEINTNANYSPPDTAGQAVSSNVSRGHYRFSEAGVNARIRVIATNEDGERFVQFGTEAYPFKEFVSVAYNGTEASETIVTYPAGIYNTEGLTYETYIETFDPETREASGEPLNILGTDDNGVFRAYVVVDFQIVTEIELAGGGDVIGTGPTVVGEIPVYSDTSGKLIQTSSKKVSDFVEVTDPLNKQSINIIANTVDIYAPDDLYNHYFYVGDAAATIKLKNPNADYTEQDRFQVFNDSEFELVINDNNDVELQIVQNAQAYEFFYIDTEFFSGWKVETLRTRGRNVLEYDVSIDAGPTLGPAQTGTLISITQSGDVIIPMLFTLEAFDNFETGDVIEITTSDSYQNYFFGVFYTSSIGQPLVVYPNNSCRLTRTDTNWTIQQDGTFLRTGIRSSVSRNQPLDPNSSSMKPVNGISIIDTPDDIASYIEDQDGHRVLQLDLTEIPSTATFVQKYSRADLDYFQIAYQGKYGDDRVYYPASIKQDGNGWTQFGFTGYLLVHSVDKSTGAKGDSVLEIRPDRVIALKQPYFNGDKLAISANNPIQNTSSFSDLIYTNGQTITEWVNANPGYTPQQFLAAVFSSVVLGGTRWRLSATTSGTDYNGTFPGTYQQVEIHRNGDNTRCFLRAYDKESNIHYYAGYKDGQSLKWERYGYAGQGLGVPIRNFITNTAITQSSPVAYYTNNSSNASSTGEIKLTNDDGYNEFNVIIYGASKSTRDYSISTGTPGSISTKRIRIQEIWECRIFVNWDDATKTNFFWQKVDDGTQGYVMDEDLVESFEANNDLILAPNDGQEIYLKDSNKDLGYGLNNVSTYFQPADGPIDLDAATYLDYGQMYAVHKNTGSPKCLMMIHETLVAELWGNPVDDINKLSMVIKSGAKAALGMVNQTAPTGGVWNYQGYAIDIATTSDNANTTNPTKYLKDDGTEATVVADYARAIYSAGTFRNDGTTLLARGVVNFTADTATPNTFTADETSDYFVCSVTVGGGTFNQFKMMPVFMTKTNNLDMYDKKAVLFSDAASAVGELLTISYEGAEDANAILEAAKTSSDFAEFKQALEDTTITLTETL